MIVALLGNSFAAYAYDPLTHSDMSKNAFDASGLKTDPKILESLGLPPLTMNKTYPNSYYFPDQRQIVELFQDGARFEDAFPRSINHFFNPLTGKGSIGSPSPDWAPPSLRSSPSAEAAAPSISTIPVPRNTARRLRAGNTSRASSATSSPSSASATPAVRRGAARNGSPTGPTPT